MLSQIPTEIALHILLFLDLSSILACTCVSRTWRALAQDNAVWRELFYGREGWGIDIHRARARGWMLSARNSMTECSYQTAHESFRTSRVDYASKVDQVIEEWRRQRLDSQSTVRSLNLGTERFYTPAYSGSSDSLVEESGDVAPLMLDWQTLYRNRTALDNRWAQDEPKVARISGHTDSVYCLEFDSTKIFTGSRDRTIKVWSIQSGKLLATFRGHMGSVLCLKFDKDWDVPTADDETEAYLRPGFMVSGSSDCSVCVWDLRVGLTGEIEAEVRAVLRGHSGGVLDLRIDDERIISW